MFPLRWRSISALLLLVGGLFCEAQAARMVAGEFLQRPEFEAFADAAAADTGLDRKSLRRLFRQVRREPAVIEAITRPVVAPPKWYEYQGQFVNAARVEAGLRFWSRNENALTRAERSFGVPAEIVVAIVGVETFYGRNTGRYRVIDALATLAFDYPRRADFFRRELIEFLVLAREQHLSPLAPEGSYAGAIGLPQFMPSSYRRYAVDFNGDRRTDLFREGPDVIGSVANFLVQHGWRRGEPVMLEVELQDEAALAELDAGLTPARALSVWSAFGLAMRELPPGAEEADPGAILVALEARNGNEYRLGFNNFQVLMRYNRSRLYASAVWDLAQALREARMRARATLSARTQSAKPAQ